MPDRHGPLKVVYQERRQGEEIPSTNWETFEESTPDDVLDRITRGILNTDPGWLGEALNPFEIQAAENEFDVEIGGEIPFPNNTFLNAAQTEKGGLFANLGGGEVVPIEEETNLSEFPTGSGEPFGLDGQFMQPVYANTTGEPISIDVVSRGFSPDDQDLDTGPYNGTEFGTDDQWYRIPTGIGTPYPISDTETAWDVDGNFEGGPISGGPDGDYELVEISETESGFKVVWEFLGSQETSLSTQDTGISSQDAGSGTEQLPEEDAEVLR